MTVEQITFKKASELIREHGPKFGARDVVGVGIDARDATLQFIVAVSSEAARERLARQYEGQTVSGLPIHVERRTMKSLTACLETASLSPRPRDRVPLWREVLDRPGYLLVAGLALACALTWAVSG